jgi:hypothetical protein
MQMLKNTAISKVFAVVLCCLYILIASLIPRFSAAAEDFPHHREAVHTIYPTRTSIMDAMTLEKDIILLAEAKDSSGNLTGRFDSCVDENCTSREAGNSQWGAVALLSYWWSKNGKNNKLVADAARRGLAFALVHRHWTLDSHETQYLRQTGMGHAYTKYFLSNCRSIGNYPSTAWALLLKAMLSKFGSELFTPEQRIEIAAQGRSNWLWLTRASKYNPQNAANQTMGAILGAYMLGDALNDGHLKNEAIAYYETGVPDTNLPPLEKCGKEPFCGGFRNVARMTVQGHQIFQEQGGFEAHYGPMHLTFHAALHYLQGADVASNIYLDALEQATYVADRISESGSLHGGTRHNDMAGSNTDMAFGLGLNFFSRKTQRDLGATRVRYTKINSKSSKDAMMIAHYSFGIILFHEYFADWNRDKRIRNSAVGMRRGDVSIFFNDMNQPQEVSVNGTSFTEAVVQNGLHAHGVYLQKADGSWVTDQSVHKHTVAVSKNFSIRTAIGLVKDPDISVKTHYIASDQTLYVVNLLRVNTPIKLRASSLLLGLPNISRTHRIVKIFDAANPKKFIDLALDDGMLSAKKIRVGDVEISAWPQVRVVNVGTVTVPPKARWMSGMNWNLTIEELWAAKSVKSFNPITCMSEPSADDTPRVWWNPKGAEPTVQFTDYIHVVARENIEGDLYEAGDVIIAVAKFSPSSTAGYADKFNVLPLYQKNSSFKMESLSIADAGLELSIDWSSAILMDLKSKEQIRF